VTVSRTPFLWWPGSPLYEDMAFFTAEVGLSVRMILFEDGDFCAMCWILIRGVYFGWANSIESNLDVKITQTSPSVTDLLT
jgi:hypothetical protein